MLYRHKKKRKTKPTYHCLAVNSLSPLKADPTRTFLIRQKAERELRRRFARLSLAIMRLLVEEDAFDLEEHDPFAFINNAFCPTGKGGGIDPTCSPNETFSAGTSASGKAVETFLDDLSEGRVSGAAADEIGNALTRNDLERKVYVKGGKVIGAVSYKVGKFAVEIHDMGSLEKGLGTSIIKELAAKHTKVIAMNAYPRAETLALSGAPTIDAISS